MDSFDRRTLKEGEEYYVCRICNAWIETEDNKANHITTHHNVSRVKDEISAAFLHLQKRLDDTYFDIELCIESLVGNQALLKIRDRLLKSSMDRLLRVIIHESEVIEQFIDAELDPSL